MMKRTRRFLESVGFVAPAMPSPIPNDKILIEALHRRNIELQDMVHEERNTVKTLVADIARDEGGAALLEYSILVGLIAGGVVALVSGVGAWIGGRWSNLNAILQTQTTP